MIEKHRLGEGHSSAEFPVLSRERTACVPTGLPIPAQTSSTVAFAA